MLLTFRCSVKSSLVKYGVKLPPNLNSHLASSVVLPGEKPENPEFEFEVQIKLLHDAKFKAGEKALVAIAKGLTLKKLCELVQEVETTLQPINPYLDMMVFFTLHKSTMFQDYLCHILDGKRQSLSQPDGSSDFFIFSSTSDDTSMEEMKLLGDALESTEELLCRVVTGSVTHLEVTACGKLSLQTLAIEREFEIFALFLPQLQKKHPEKLRVLKGAGLEGVKNMLELFQFEHHISDMHTVFEKYAMHGCLNDKNFLMLLDIRKELSDESKKAQLTALQATKYLQTVKSALCFHIKEDCMCLKIFPAISVSDEFYRFLEEKREKGKDTFENEYQLITTQLQHEDYDELVLNHLGSAYGYVQPFLQKEQSLHDLMQQVLRFDADSAVMELETVNSNIMLVQLWFLRSEVRGGALV